MYARREMILEVLNAAVGFWYIVLSVGFFLILAQLWRALIQDVHRPGAGGFPKWWCRHGRKIVGSGFVGTSLFLSGCGFHHLHLAFEMVPMSVNLSRHFHVPLAQNPWVGSHFAHHVLIMGGQFVGAPLLIASGVLAWLAIRQRAEA